MWTLGTPEPPLSARACSVLVWFYSLFAKFSKQKPKTHMHAHAHAHKCTHPPPPPSTKTLSLALRLHFSGTVGAHLLTAHAATCAPSEQLFQ